MSARGAETRRNRRQPPDRLSVSALISPPKTARFAETCAWPPTSGRNFPTATGPAFLRLRHLREASAVPEDAALLAAPARLRLPALEIFAQRQLQPLLSRIFHFQPGFSGAFCLIVLHPWACRVCRHERQNCRNILCFARPPCNRRSCGGPRPKPAKMIEFEGMIRTAPGRLGVGQASREPDRPRDGAGSSRKRVTCADFGGFGPFPALPCACARGPCGKNRPPVGAFRAASRDTGHAAVAQW